MRLTIALIVVVLSAALISAAPGAQQLAGGPTTGGTTTHAYGTSEFKLGPDDVIEVSVYQDKELSATVPVRPDGKISLAIIGEMPASGKTASELQKEISQKYASIITNPAVTVIVKEVNSPKVTIAGEVKNPGVYKIRDRATVLDVVAMAGGCTEYAKKNKVVLIRTGPNGDQRPPIKINLDDQIKGRRSEPVYVQPYDKIYVP